MKVIDFVKALPRNTEIIVRGAFQSGWGEEPRPAFYEGLSQDFPVDSKYKARPVVFTSYYKYKEGDVCSIKEADGIDIAVGDINEYV